MIIGKKEITDAFQKTAAVNMYDAVSKSIKTVQAEAKTRCPVNDGELRREYIHGDRNQQRKDCRHLLHQQKVRTICGIWHRPQRSEATRGDITGCCLCLCTVALWIHESMIGRKTAEKYKWFYVDTPDGRFYQCTGQAAQPFLYPALKNNELEIAHYFEEAIEKNL